MPCACLTLYKTGLPNPRDRAVLTFHKVFGASALEGGDSTKHLVTTVVFTKIASSKLDENDLSSKTAYSHSSPDTSVLKWGYGNATELECNSASEVGVRPIFLSLLTRKILLKNILQNFVCGADGYRQYQFETMDCLAQMSNHDLIQFLLRIISKSNPSKRELVMLLIAELDVELTFREFKRMRSYGRFKKAKAEALALYYENE